MPTPHGGLRRRLVSIQNIGIAADHGRGDRRLAVRSGMPREAGRERQQGGRKRRKRRKRRGHVSELGRKGESN